MIHLDQRCLDLARNLEYRLCVHSDSENLSVLAAASKNLGSFWLKCWKFCDLDSKWLSSSSSQFYPTWSWSL
ncbi:hypothetical protein BpHYR1_027201 [Brachionus plicatilis]|uniref:Uncharacterized protein n=1 Tax=Brachionus plicatilis TaxID=10195 RepID=A0A3M7P7E9_BRAPC|nr:hypothetical protein BpHYR1_027201 [Brachionus plicatilis]